MWIIRKGGAEVWAEIKEKPTTYPPEAHAHSVNDVGTGTRNNTTFLRGDGVWVAPSGGTFKYNADSTAMIPQDNADSWIVGSDRMERDPADATKDKRAFFNKANGSFRSGVASGIEFDPNWNSGTGSAAFGVDTRASASGTFAAGYKTWAGASGCVTFGSETTADSSDSFAWGFGSKAGAPRSYAGGNVCQVTEAGWQASAVGENARASRWGQHSRSGGAFAENGDAQSIAFVARRQTTDATATTLTFNDVAPSIANSGYPGTNVLTVTASRAFKIKIDVVARRTDVQGEMAGFTWEGLVGRDSTGNARIIGTPTTNKWNDAGATAWALGVSINTTDATNNYLQVTGTGELTKTIRWVANIDAVEVGG